MRLSKEVYTNQKPKPVPEASKRWNSGVWKKKPFIHQPRSNWVKPDRAQLNRLSVINEVKTGNYYFGLTATLLLLCNRPY